MKNIAYGLLLSLSIAAPAVAQQQQPIAPLNSPLGALLTFTAQVPATVASAAQTNLYGRGVSCTYNQTAHVGSTPSTVVSIQAYDKASNAYLTMASTGAVTTESAATVVVYPGISASGPTAWTGFSGRMGRQWRVSATITGGTSVTGTVGCEMLP